MFCQNCGNEMNDGAVFCNQCGKPVTGGSSNTQENEEFQERLYTFKNVPDSQSLMAVIKGGEAVFGITEDMLVTQEEKKYQNKVMGIPYNEIKSFEIKDKFSTGIIIADVFALLLSLGIMLGMDVLVGLVCVVISIIIFVVMAKKSVFTVNVSDGRRLKVTLKQIGKDKINDKNRFINDLNSMISKAPTLQNITKAQSQIIIGYTKADWKSVASDIFDNLTG